MQGTRGSDRNRTGPHLQHCLLLLVIVVIDGTAVLRAHVISLAVLGRGVDLVEEVLQQLLVADLLRVEVHL